MNPFHRRTFLQQSVLAGAALTVTPILSRVAGAQTIPRTGGGRDARPQLKDGDWRQPSRALRGVNLGAWLVLEKWMTPSLFAGIEAGDEWSFSQVTGARERLENHRQTFVTERDFEWIKAHGLDAVRLPIGYWTLEASAPYISGAQHVDNAMQWARNQGLQVLIDLHGAPGSQNGFDHSGRSGAVGWTKPENIEATIHALEVIARRYGNHRNLWGIECLNEPRWDVPLDTLKAFYAAAYPRVRAHLPLEKAFVMHDGFRPFNWGDWMDGPQFENVVLDTHIYQAYTDDDRKRSPADHVIKAYDRARELKEIGANKWTIIGEWSDAIAWDAVKNLSPLQRELTTRGYGAAQLASYETSHGWFYWSLKAENPGEWNFMDMVERGLLPENFGLA